MSSSNGTKGEFRGFSLDVNRKVLWRGGEIVSLPPKAIEMLIVLLRNRGSVVSKQELLDAVWGETFVEESVLSNNVYLLRKAIGEVEPGRSLITTVARRGYKFEDSSDDPASDFVLEHHVFEQTLIEDVSNESLSGLEPQTTKRKLGIRFSSRRNAVVALSLGAIFLLSGIGFLEWRQMSAARSLSEIRSIAVLPLKPIAGTEAEAVLSLGLADVLITQLGASERLIVYQVGSVSEYVGKDFDPIAAGSKLGAEAVLEGTIQRSDQRLRVNARLLRISDGSQMWSGAFNETETDILALQDAIATAVAGALFAAINQSERELILQRYKRDVGAYEAYLRGRYEFYRSGVPVGERYPKAIAEFEKAIAIDNDYALAHAGIADSYSQLANYSTGERRAMLYAKAKESALRALSLDDTLAETHASIGWINRIYDWDWDASERHLRRAIELAPNDARNHYLYSFLLITLGRTDEALVHARRSRELDPVSKTAAHSYALTCDRRFEEALDVGVPILETTPDNSIWRGMIAAYIHAGRSGEALSLYERTPAAIREEVATSIHLPIIYANLGDRAKAEEVLRELEVQARDNAGRTVRLAAVYAVLGRDHDALDALETGLTTRDDRMVWLKTNPFFDTLRDEPRFQAILRKMNL